MEKRKISAKELATDVKSGLSYKDLLTKYEIEASVLNKFFATLVERHVLKPGDIPFKVGKMDLGTLVQPGMPRLKSQTETKKTEGIALGSDQFFEADTLRASIKPKQTGRVAPAPAHIFQCPSCNYSQPRKFTTCPVCGVIVDKFVGERSTRANISSETVSPAKEGQPAKPANSEKSCNKCGKMMPSAATVCPHCKAFQADPYLIFMVVSFAVVFGLAGLLCGKNWMSYTFTGAFSGFLSAIIIKISQALGFKRVIEGSIIMFAAFSGLTIYDSLRSPASERPSASSSTSGRSMSQCERLQAARRMNFQLQRDNHLMARDPSRPADKRAFDMEYLRTELYPEMEKIMAEMRSLGCSQIDSHPETPP